MGRGAGAAGVPEAQVTGAEMCPRADIDGPCGACHVCMAWCDAGTLADYLLAQGHPLADDTDALYDWLLSGELPCELADYAEDVYAAASVCWGDRQLGLPGIPQEAAAHRVQQIVAQAVAPLEDHACTGDCYALDSGCPRLCA